MYSSALRERRFKQGHHYPQQVRRFSNREDFHETFGC